MQQEILHFLQAIYGSAEGYFTIDYGTQDERGQLAGTHREAHYYTPSQAHRIARALERRCHLFDNQWLSTGLFSSRAGHSEQFLPSHALWVDDVAPEHWHLFDVVLETSPNNAQGWLLLDRQCEREEYTALQKRLSAHVHGNSNGEYPGKLGRLPGSTNVKGRECDGFVASLKAINATPRYSPEGLVLWLQAQPQAHTSPPASATGIDWEHAETLLNGGLMETARVKKALSLPHIQQQLESRDTSRARYQLARSLVVQEFPATEIAAVLFAVDMGAIERKGRRWLKEDIERILGDKLADLYHAKPHRATHLPGQSRQQWRTTSQTGKRASLTAEQYYEWLVEHSDLSGAIPLSQSQIAAALEVSQPLIAALEKELKATGQIERHVSADRRQSYLTLTGLNAEMQAAVDAQLQEQEVFMNGPGESLLPFTMGDAPLADGSRKPAVCAPFSEEVRDKEQQQEENQNNTLPVIRNDHASGDDGLSAMPTQSRLCDDPQAAPQWAELTPLETPIETHPPSAEGLSWGERVGGGAGGVSLSPEPELTPALQEAGHAARGLAQAMQDDPKHRSGYIAGIREIYSELRAKGYRDAVIVEALGWQALPYLPKSPTAGHKARQKRMSGMGMRC